MKFCWIVELQDRVWLARWSGDPGRTFIRSSAREYTTERGAKIALGMARRYRRFSDAWVYRTLATKPNQKPR